MSMSSRRERDTFNEINITPLTDIFLVLLIIMMVIAPLLDQQGLNLMVPTEHEEVKKQEKDPKIINIIVSEKGEYSIDGSSVTAEKLLDYIKESYKEKKDGLLIKAAENSTHGSVVTVMDAAQTAGITNISVVEN